MVTQATADIAGSNTITDNAAQGIFVQQVEACRSAASTFTFPSVNTISGNGNATQAGGVFGFLGRFARHPRRGDQRQPRLRASILSMRSQAQLFNSQILNNVAAGTGNPETASRLFFGSALHARALRPRS